MADGAQAEPWNHSPGTVPGTAPGKIGVEVFAGREGVCQPPAGGHVVSDGGPRPAQVFPRSPDKAAPKILFGHPCAQPGGQGAQGGAGAWGWAGLAGQGLRPQYKAPRAGRAFAQVRGAHLASSGGKAGSGGHLSSRTMPGPWLLLLFCGGTLLSGEWGLRATLRGGQTPRGPFTWAHLSTQPEVAGREEAGGWQATPRSGQAALAKVRLAQPEGQRLQGPRPGTQWAGVHGTCRLPNSRRVRAVLGRQHWAQP